MCPLSATSSGMDVLLPVGQKVDHVPGLSKQQTERGVGMTREGARRGFVLLLGLRARNTRKVLPYLPSSLLATSFAKGVRTARSKCIASSIFTFALSKVDDTPGGGR